ncbi:hypothetical protein BS78_03G158000 [Paspalum vaginatum]|nr:hypothetical protein BS78_03G158000 [Paspalum vaginatum]
MNIPHKDRNLSAKQLPDPRHRHQRPRRLHQRPHQRCPRRCRLHRSPRWLHRYPRRLHRRPRQRCQHPRQHGQRRRRRPRRHPQVQSRCRLPPPATWPAREGQAALSPGTSGSVHGRPSYADMAGRPPPQHFRNNGPPHPRQDLPARNNPRHYQYEGRGQGPGRGRVDGRAGSDHGRGEALDCGRAPTHQAREQHYQAVPPRAQQIGPNGLQFGAGASVAESSQQGKLQQQQRQTTQVQDAGVAKVKKRPFCWRCKCGGHSNEECQPDLDCFICNKKNIHVPFKCPILKKPKPTATFFGSGKTEFGFLQIMDDDYTSDTPEPTPTALVKISGGTISAEVIQSELARITRVDWKWEALPHGKDSFLVVFPSEDEMQRMTNIDFWLKNHGGVTLTISEWQNASSVPHSYKIDEVWVHISGVPHVWRHYLVFWALGTVIGATLDVDMLTYRKKGIIRVLVGVLDKTQLPFIIIRVLVGVLDKTQLPFTIDLVFGKDGYDITYTLEDESFVPATLIASGHPPSDRDGKKKDEDGSTGKDHKNMSKKQKNLTGGSASLPTSESPETGPMKF